MIITQKIFSESWLNKELTRWRNFGPLIHKFGGIIGGALAFIDNSVFFGKLPWTLNDKKADHETLKPACDMPKIKYPKTDNIICFDKLSSVFLSNTNHEEDQPCHLRLKSPELHIEKNLPLFDEPAQRYCPAGVYEIIENEQGTNNFKLMHKTVSIVKLVTLRNQIKILCGLHLKEQAGLTIQICNNYLENS